MHSFTMIPQDVLFLRDARPMEAADAGLGANWPRPDQLYSAIHHALLREWPEPQTWEGNGEHTFRNKKLPENKGRSKDKNENSSFRFGALKTLGPFPAKGGTVYLPCPLDLGMKLIPIPEGQTDLPAPLTHAFLPKKEGKATFPQWIPTEMYRHYMRGEDVAKPELEEIDIDKLLYAPDRNIGIAIDPETGTTVEHKLYQAEYLRLKEDVSLAFQAECLVKARGGNGQGRDLFVEDWTGGDLVMGGQQGIVRVERTSPELALPALPNMATPYLRWTLLTPAVFKDGWLPGWCKDSCKNIAEDQKSLLGTVMLRDCGFARLVAARVGKPEAFSGWELDLPERGRDRQPRSGRPKPTRLAVPAGSCYVFDCGSVENAKLLAGQLHLKPRSDELGEKGYGLGACSSVQI